MKSLFTLNEITATLYKITVTLSEITVQIMVTLSEITVKIMVTLMVAEDNKTPKAYHYHHSNNARNCANHCYYTGILL